MMIVDDLDELARAGAAMATAIGSDDPAAIDSAARLLTAAVARVRTATVPAAAGSARAATVAALARTLADAARRVERLTAVTRRRRAMVAALGGSITRGMTVEG